MATDDYFDWIRDGKPFTLATPVQEYRKALRRAGFSATNVGTIGDKAHLTASTPEDHTPFSRTGWPDVHPYPYVLALDLSGALSDGLSWIGVVRYWLEEARAGRTPWVKYVKVQGMRYDVRNGWKPVVASGHYDHGHVSFRTDWKDHTIGDWKVLPDRESSMDEVDKNVAWATTNRALALLTGEPCVFKTTDEDEPRNEGNWQADTLRAILERLDELVTRPPAVVDPLALAQALVAHEGFTETLATALASRVGMIPTAGEIAREVGSLTWHGVVR